MNSVLLGLALTFAGFSFGAAFYKEEPALWRASISLSITCVLIAAIL